MENCNKKGEGSLTSNYSSLDDDTSSSFSACVEESNMLGEHRNPSSGTDVSFCPSTLEINNNSKSRKRMTKCDFSNCTSPSLTSTRSSRSSIGVELLDKNETEMLRAKHVGPSCQLFFKSDPLKIVRAKGQYMYDDEGNEYMDCINNVAHVGHCHSHIVEVASQQMANLYTNNRFLHDNMVLYAERITQTLPQKLSVAYFVNSGSEANDLALQLARTYTGSKETITLDHAYHGHVTSLMEISPYKWRQAKDYEKTKQFMKPDYVHVAQLPDVYRGKYRECDFKEDQQDLGELYAKEIEEICQTLKERKNKHVGAFIAESMQSCGGQIVYPKSYLKRVYEIIHEHGGVCIADEVQVGMGRMGNPHWWAFQTYGEDVIPDIVTIGKPIGNGHPISVVITSREIADKFASTGITYFNTFGGNAVSCAIANAVLDVIEDEQLMENAKIVGEYLHSKLIELQRRVEYSNLIGDIRGKGLFYGIDLVENCETRVANEKAAVFISQKLKERKILLQSDGPHNNVLKFKSPMCFTTQNVDTLINELDLAMSEFLSILIKENTS